MKSLFESGLQHVLSGETSVEELLRVVDVPMDERSTGRRGAAQRQHAAAAQAQHAAFPARQSRPERRPGHSRRSVVPVADLTTAFDADLTTRPRAPRSSGRSTAHRCSWWTTRIQLRRVMKDLLAREGYAVIEARNGVEALDQVDRHAPDVIVLDLEPAGHGRLLGAVAAPLPSCHQRRPRSSFSPPRATRTTRSGSSSSAPTISHQALPSQGAVETAGGGAGEEEGVGD